MSQGVGRMFCLPKTAWPPTYVIVGSAESDPMNFKISNESPVGRAFVGKKVGDVIEVAVPGGVSKFEILDIRRD